MNNPIEMLRQGFEEQSWEKIAEAYKLMTGADLQQKVKASIPTPKKRGRKTKVSVVVPTPEDVRIIGSENPNEIDYENFKLTRKERSQDVDDESGRTFCKKRPLNPFKNQFKDNLKLEKEAGEVDKKIGRVVSDRREPPAKMNVKCVSCGKSESVNVEIGNQYASQNDPDSDRPDYVCSSCL